MPESAVEQKLASFQAWIVAGLAFMFVASVSFVAVAIAVVLITTGRASDRQYQSDQALACYVQPQFDRAEKTLPTITYYRQHPKELEDQLALIAENRKLALEAWGACDRPPP